MIIEFKGKNGHYKTKDSFEYLIRYVTRTRPNEDRANELLGIGSAGICLLLGVESIINQFITTEVTFRSNTQGRHLYHLIAALSKEEFDSLNCEVSYVDTLAQTISRLFFGNGFQCLYGIHYDETKYIHIHFVISSTSYINGHRFHINATEVEELRKYCNDILLGIIAYVKEVTPTYAISETY